MATKKKSSEEIPASAAKSKKSPAINAASKKPVKVAAAAAEGLSARALQLQPSPAELHEEIRVRAYQIYCERGGGHGLHESDWHRAELEVRAKYDN